jgi:hypothetical protein
VETNLITYYSFLIDIVKSSGRVNAIYTDLKKAFNSVDHNILVLKLNKLGIGYPLLSCLSSYLSNRSFCANINCHLSSNTTVTSDVPLGSHLSPLLFIIFINDVGSSFKFCKYLLFTDNLKINLPVKSNIGLNQLQQDLDSFLKLYNLNGLSVDPSKFNYILFNRQKNKSLATYKINNFEVQNTSIVRDLGVLLSSDLILIRAIGFINRNCHEFKNFNLKVL